MKTPILEPSDVQGLSEEQLNELLKDGSLYWFAVTIPLNNGGYIIIHNPTHSPARQQSNLMHELAHILDISVIKLSRLTIDLVDST